MDPCNDCHHRNDYCSIAASVVQSVQKSELLGSVAASLGWLGVSSIAYAAVAPYGVVADGRANLVDWVGLTSSAGVVRFAEASGIRSVDSD